MIFMGNSNYAIYTGKCGPYACFYYSANAPSMLDGRIMARARCNALTDIYFRDYYLLQLYDIVQPNQTILFHQLKNKQAKS